MRHFTVLIFLLFLSGCSTYTIENKININDLKNQSGANTIFANSVDLITLSKLNSPQEKGTFSIFIVDQNSFLRANSNYSNENIIKIQGELIQKIENSTLKFTLTYDKFRDKLEIESSDNAYSYNLKPPILNQDSKPEVLDKYFISKSKNYIITPNVLEIISGEISRNYEKGTPFIIINDPSHPSNYLAALGILEAMFFSNKDHKKYLADCIKLKKERKIDLKCKENEVELEFDFKILRFEVNCKCKE